MSRLIYDDKLIEVLKENIKKLVKEIKFAETEGQMRIFVAQLGQTEEIIDVINRQSTAYDVDDILRQCKDRAVELMDIQYSVDECNMFSKGVQAMYLAIEKIIKEGVIND